MWIKINTTQTATDYSYRSQMHFYNRFIQAIHCHVPISILKSSVDNITVNKWAEMKNQNHMQNASYKCITGILLRTRFISTECIATTATRTVCQTASHHNQYYQLSLSCTQPTSDEWPVIWLVVRCRSAN